MTDRPCELCGRRLDAHYLTRHRRLGWEAECDLAVTPLRQGRAFPIPCDFDHTKPVRHRHWHCTVCRPGLFGYDTCPGHRPVSPTFTATEVAALDRSLTKYEWAR